MKEKLMSLKEAVGLIPSGSTVAVGGNQVRRHPMALIRQMIRAGINDLTLYGWVSGLDVDLLVGAGVVKRVEAAYVGLGALGFAPNYRRAVQNGEIEIEDFSETSMMARFRAASMGLPFFPTRALSGTDMARYATHAAEITCPFTGEKLQAVAAAKADVVILHGYSADRFGNVQWPLLRNSDDIDPIIVRSADKVIVTVEQIVSHEAVLQNSTLTYVPHNWVTAVVETPFGAHPGSCDGIYNADDAHLQLYAEAGKSAEGFAAYISEYITGTKDEWEYLKKASNLEHLMSLKVRGGAL